MLPFSLQMLLRWYVDLDAAVDFASPTAALTQLGGEGALAIMRQRPELLGAITTLAIAAPSMAGDGERAKESPLITHFAPASHVAVQPQCRRALYGETLSSCYCF